MGKRMRMGHSVFMDHGLHPQRSAPTIARSGSRATMALTRGLRRSMCWRCAAIVSRADSYLARIRRASSVAVMKQMSSVGIPASSLCHYSATQHTLKYDLD